uniref:RAD50-interacting protein 1 n=1 Tax=Ditylenchus dipsaci TaxID=166011 RepID=A0A915CQK8_9BILA
MEELNPELAKSMEELSEKQQELAHLKFVKNFSRIRDEIPDEAEEFSNLSETKYNVKIESLDRNCLLEVYARIRFPFEDAVDYLSIQSHLETTVEIMKCLHVVHSNTPSYNKSMVLDIVLEEFGKRFNFHFYGDKPTNSASNRNGSLLKSLCGYATTWNTSKSLSKISLMRPTKLASKKVKSLIRQNNFVQDRRLLSHLIDETVVFEKEMHETYEYSEDEPLHVISELCQETVLDTWFKLERDTISIGIDSILADPDAYESRYKGAADVDTYFVPNFADSFVILMQSMFERYRSIPNVRLQCRFVKLQLIIVDEFRSRMVQMRRFQWDKTGAMELIQRLEDSLIRYQTSRNDLSDVAQSGKKRK